MMLSDPIFTTLDPDQRRAVLHDGGPLLLVAGAGSGKTRAIVARIVRLLRDGVPAKSILGITFTNRAAREMTRRVEALIGADVSSALAGTFHSVAARLLRPNAELIGYRPNFSILDTEDAKDLLESATSDLAIPVTERRFPKGDLLRELLSLAVNRGRTLGEAVASEAPHFLAQPGREGRVVAGVLAKLRRRRVDPGPKHVRHGVRKRSPRRGSGSRPPCAPSRFPGGKSLGLPPASAVRCPSPG